MIGTGLIALCYMYNWQIPWKFKVDLDKLPAIPEVVTHFLILLVCEDFCFYFTHRAFHHPLLYKRFHKQHHEINHNVSVAALACHPVEFIVSDLYSPFSGIVLLGSRLHALTLILYHAWRVFEGHEVHCGYDFPWSVFRVIPLQSDATYHDFHHSRNVGNFASSLTIWDTICGTNTVYYEYLEKRNG